MKLLIILSLLSINAFAGTNSIIETLVLESTDKEYILNTSQEILEKNYRNCPDRIDVRFKDDKKLNLLLPSREYPTLSLVVNSKKKNSTLSDKCYVAQNQYQWTGKTCATSKQRTSTSKGTLSVEFEEQERGYFNLKKMWDHRIAIKRATLSLDGKITIESLFDKYNHGSDGKKTTCIYEKIK